MAADAPGGTAAESVRGSMEAAEETFCVHAQATRPRGEAIAADALASPVGMTGAMENGDPGEDAMAPAASTPAKPSTKNCAGRHVQE